MIASPPTPISPPPKPAACWAETAETRGGRLRASRPGEGKAPRPRGGPGLRRSPPSRRPAARGGLAGAAVAVRHDRDRCQRPRRRWTAGRGGRHRSHPVLFRRLVRGPGLPHDERFRRRSRRRPLWRGVAGVLPAHDRGGFLLPRRHRGSRSNGMKRAIVVGTGAGGATVARSLAGAFDVTVVEAGSEFRRFEGGIGPIERLRSSRLLLRPQDDPPALSPHARHHGLRRHGARARGRHRWHHHSGDRQRASLRRGSARARHRPRAGIPVAARRAPHLHGPPSPLAAGHQRALRGVRAPGTRPCGDPQARRLRALHALREVRPRLPHRGQVG